MIIKWANIVQAIIMKCLNFLQVTIMKWAIKFFTCNNHQVSQLFTSNNHEMNYLFFFRATFITTSQPFRIDQFHSIHLHSLLAFLLCNEFFLCAILLIFCVLFNHHSSFVFFHHLFLRSSNIFGVRFYIFSIFLLCALQLFFSSL